MKWKDDLKMDTPSRKAYYYVDPSSPKWRFACDWQRQEARERRAAQSRSHDRSKRNRRDYRGPE